MDTPRYFVAVFGEPSPPNKDTIESGIYHPDQKLAPFPSEPGDILLIYCTDNYPAHRMEVPGFGIVLGTDDQTVRYRYLPLVKSIPKSKIERSFGADDIAKFKSRRFSTYWLFEISKESFLRTVGKQGILWP